MVDSQTGREEQSVLNAGLAEFGFDCCKCSSPSGHICTEVLGKYGSAYPETAVAPSLEYPLPGLEMMKLHNHRPWRLACFGMEAKERCARSMAGGLVKESNAKTSTSGLASPPSTPTQSSSPSVFSLDAPCSATERLEERRARSLSSPPDTDQRFSLASSYSKPPIFTSSSSSSAFSPGPAAQPRLLCLQLRLPPGECI
ncbi:hypothetical protein MHYP_G00351590 [Metynnis hypsauchen]